MAGDTLKSGSDLLSDWNLAAVALLKSNPLTAKKKGLVLLDSQKALNEYYAKEIVKLVEVINILKG